MKQIEASSLIRGYLLAHDAPPEIMLALGHLGTGRTATTAEVLDLPSSVLLAQAGVGISVGRVAAVFKEEGIATVGDVLQKSPSYFLKMPNFGRKSLNILIEGLRAYGLELKRP